VAFRGEDMRALTTQREAEHPETATEDIHIRNYDTRESHTLWVRVVEDGTCVFERSYRLRPGEAESELDALPEGEYDVEVELDGLRRRVGRCEVGEGPERTVLVEMGNGTVSVTEGVVG
jgi:hypothetical protein